MNEKMVIKTAKSLNREKFILEKLNKQIETLKEKEASLKKELETVSGSLEESKQREMEIKQINEKVRIVAEEEILKNKKEHSELQMLKEMKKTIQKEFSRAQQDNLNIKHALEALREKRKIAEGNLNSLQETYSQLSNEKDMYNNELLQYKQEYDDLLQLYELKKNEDVQLKTLYNHHFK
jgi:chromosome segregation ATPase